MTILLYVQFHSSQKTSGFRKTSCTIPKKSPTQAKEGHLKIVSIPYQSHRSSLYYFPIPILSYVSIQKVPALSNSGSSRSIPSHYTLNNDHSISSAVSIIKASPPTPHVQRDNKKGASNQNSNHSTTVVPRGCCIPCHPAPHLGFMHCLLALITDQIILFHTAGLSCGTKSRSLSRYREPTQTMKNNSFPD